MHIYEILLKKRDGKQLSEAEINYLVRGIVDGTIPDYQISALLMAIYFQGMSFAETAILTHAMAHSGEMADLSALQGVKVDKHSTGGVGDKTTLIVAPIVASCGVLVPKMSGRGLGHTGGTVDKLEAIEGFQTMLSKDAFMEVVRTAGLAIVGQSGNFAPADKKLYALRDVTATVDSIPLIAASIMSKKLAAGADAIVLDVKMGSGAFMSTLERSIELAQTMVEIGLRVGKKTVALITDMDTPLGDTIGNSLEVIEAIHTLKGIGARDLTEVSIELAANMLLAAGKGAIADCRVYAQEAIKSGRAFASFQAMVQAQGGNVQMLNDILLFKKCAFKEELLAPCDGYIARMDTQCIGRSAVCLGAGREVKDAPIEYSAGVLLHAKTGSFVKKGQCIAMLCANDAPKLKDGKEMYLSALEFSQNKPPSRPLIYGRVTQNGFEKHE